MILNVVTPYGAKFENIEITSITLPGEVGEMQVLPGHEALMSALRIGVMTVIDARDNVTVAAISGGYVEVLEDTVNCLVETCETRDEIDVERARKKLETVTKALESIDHGTSEYKTRQQSAKKARVRIEVGTQNHDQRP